MVAAEARLHAAGQQSAGVVPWVGSHDEDVRGSELYHSRTHQLQHFQLGGPDKLTGADEPWHTLQESVVLADLVPK